MTIRRNGAEIGTTGTAITSGNVGTTTADPAGDAFNVATITGSPTFEISTAQAYSGTRSIHIAGGSGTVGTPRYTGMSTSVVTGFVRFRMATLLGAAGTHVQVFSAGGSGYVSIAQNSSNQLQVKDALGSVLATLSGYTLLVNTWYRLEFRFISGSTTSNGTIQVYLYAAATTQQDGAGTTLASYSATNVNAGAAVTYGQLKMMGKLESGTTMDGYYDDYALSDTSTMPSLPGANTPPVAAWDGTTPTDADADAGTVHVKANFTDDGNLLVSNATITRQSGPDSPTITPSGSGNGTPAISLDADITMIPGTYVLRAANIDGSAAASNNADQTIYVAPVANTFTAPAAASLGAGSTFGSPASTLAAVSDASDSTGIQSTASPVAEVLGPFTMPPHSLGPITCKRRLSIEDDTAPAAVVRFRFYKADGVTLIDTAPDLTISTESPTDYDYQLSSAAHAAVPLRSDRRALKYDIVVNP